MTDRPISFSPPMIRALLEGRKTQTRRVLKPAYEMAPGHPMFPKYFNGERDGETAHPEYTDLSDENVGRVIYAATPVCPADRFYVREAWRVTKRLDDVRPRDMDRTTIPEWLSTDPPLYEGRKRASFHLPRWASRLTLIVTDVRVQRLQEISELDAVAEGTREPSLRDLGGHLAQAAMSERQVFHRLWNSLNAKRGYGWDVNPWVVALTFTVHQQNIDEVRP